MLLATVEVEGRDVRSGSVRGCEVTRPSRYWSWLCCVLFVCMSGVMSHVTHVGFSAVRVLCSACMLCE